MVTTGNKVDRGQPTLSKAVAILQKPHTESDLINAIQKATVAASITPDKAACASVPVVGQFHHECNKWERIW